MSEEMSSTKEIVKYIDWLESELDKCLLCDLPFEHIERELYYYTRLVYNQNQSEKVFIN